jgi:uncharacterized protein YodC (DUF2158 family)
MAEQNDFGPGSVVRLKSGGPAMVIKGGRSTLTLDARAAYDGYWNCVWFTDECETRDAIFGDHVLMLTEPDPWPRPITMRDAGP